MRGATILKSYRAFVSSVFVGILLFSVSAESESLSRSSSRIFGGEPVPAGELSSVIAITNENGTPFCSGTLIAKNIVITAAHCIYTLDSIDGFKDRGRVYKGSGNEGGLTPQYQVNQVYVHPEYTESKEYNRYDIALIVLDRDASNSMNGLIKPVLLQTEANELYKANGSITIAGFGRTEEKIKGVKYKAQTTIKEIYEQEFFAGGSGVDTCSGDSGGPVFAKNSIGEMKLIGITSRGSAFCKYGGIYGRTDMLLNWIDFKTLWDKANYTPPQYNPTKDGTKAMNSGDYQKAIKHYRKTFESGPESVKKFVQLAVAYAGSGYEKAHSGDNIGAKKDYKNAFRFRAKGWMLKGDEYLSEALGDLTKAIKIDPKDADLYDDRAKVYRKLGLEYEETQDLEMSQKLRGVM